MIFDRITLNRMKFKEKNIVENTNGWMTAPIPNKLKSKD